MHVFCTQCGGALVEPALSDRFMNAFPATETSGGLTLEWVRGPGADEGAALELRQGEQSIGTQGVVSLAGDAHASAHHARVTLANGALRVADTGSDNGTWVRLRGAEFSLGDGDLFRVGEQWLRFDLHAAHDAPTDGQEIAGTPLRPWRLKVTQLLEGGGEGLVYSTRRDRLAFGRVDCDVNFIGDSYVSGSHCELRWREGAVVLRDLGSLNGTFVALPKGVDVALQEGDEIGLGRHLLRVIPAT